MQKLTRMHPWILAAALTLAASPAWADGEAPAERHEERAPGSIAGLALSGDAGYYTYGMDDVNSRFNQGMNNDIHGGMGYGAAVKLGITDHFAAKVGVDYLFASRDSTRTIGVTTYDTRVNMPATMLFVGGEFVVLPLAVVNLKVFGGYTLVNIFNGNQRSTDSSNLDLGSVTGTGSGFQAGLGAEVFLARGFSLEGSVAYNYAKIDNATFAGAPADPSSVNSNGTVDYSGVVAKLAFNLYLFR